MTLAFRPRYLMPQAIEDLADKMVFIGGPRQVGKTALSLSMAADHSPDYRGYFNWDVATHRRILMSGELPADVPLLICDEIHKFKNWRSMIKGLYDTRHHKQSIIVTGSARLDFYRRSGDSLQGRYHYLRLHPFSVMELGSDDAVGSLLKYGGFPEPLFKQKDAFWRRWQIERNERLVREDVRELERVNELSLLELLVDLLPQKVGSPLSVRSLREDLQVAHETVERWIQILERLYFCYRIPPFGAPKIRAVKKEQKIYMWDWSLTGQEGGARFENFVAGQLLKFCHFQEDALGHRMELRYLRDIDGREIDFVVIRNKKPIFAVECKSGEKAASKHLAYFKERTNIPEFFQVHLGTKDFIDTRSGARIMPFAKFCRELQMP